MSQALWRSFSGALLILFFALALGCTKKGDVERGGKDFALKDLDGKTIRLADYQGKVVLLEFWATWCEPCKTEMPLIQRLHDDFGAKGLKVLSVSLDGPDTVSGVEPYIQTQGYTFQVVIDEDTSIAQAINPRTVAPFTVILGRDGQVAKTIEGFQLSESEHIIATVKQLLGVSG